MLAELISTTHLCVPILTILPSYALQSAPAQLTRTHTHKHTHTHTHTMGANVIDGQLATSKATSEVHHA